jgi:hypothetical protein
MRIRSSLSVPAPQTAKTHLSRGALVPLGVARVELLSPLLTWVVNSPNSRAAVQPRLFAFHHLDSRVFSLSWSESAHHHALSRMKKESAILFESPCLTPDLGSGVFRRRLPLAVCTWSRANFPHHKSKMR